MKYAMLASLMMFSVYASAHDGANNNASAPEPERYNYSEHLDIAKVIDIYYQQRTQTTLVAQWTRTWCMWITRV